MILNRTNTVLAVLLVIVVGLAAMSGVDYSKPNVEVLPDMKYTPAWTAFEENPNFPNGRTLQTPVPGTVARGELPLHYEATKEEALRAGEELINPYEFTTLDADDPADAEAAAPAGFPVAGNEDGASEISEEAKREAAARERLQTSIGRGGEIFRVFCISCHGPQGAGDGPVTQRGFPPPPSMLTGNSLQMKDGQLFHILTYGQGSMAPFAVELSRDQRWDVINYVRDLQSKAAPPPETPPADPAADTDVKTGSATENADVDAGKVNKDADTPGTTRPAAPRNKLRDPASDDRKKPANVTASQAEKKQGTPDDN